MFQKDISWKNLFMHDDVFIDVVTVLSALNKTGQCRPERRKELEQRKQQLACIVSNDVSNICEADKMAKMTEYSERDSITVTQDASVTVTEKDTISFYHNSSNGKEFELRRDVFRDWLKNNVKIACIGLENQTDISKEMPIRVLRYDMSHYSAQISINKGKNNRNSNDTSGETEGEKQILPVITLVLYMGVARKWIKPVCLIDCLDLENFPKEFIHLVQNYKMNLFQLAFLPSNTIELFTSDIAIIIDYLQQKQATNSYDYNKNGGIGKKRRMRHPRETLRVLSNLFGEKWIEKLYDIHKNENITGGITMCEVIEKIKEKERAKVEQKLSFVKARAAQELSDVKASAAQKLSDVKANSKRKVAKAKSEGIALGERRGELKRSKLLSQLFKLLKADAKYEEMQRALDNEKYYQQLLQKYQLA